MHGTAKAQSDEVWRERCWRCARAIGYQVVSPYGDRGWIVRKESDGGEIQFFLLSDHREIYKLICGLKLSVQCDGRRWRVRNYQAVAWGEWSGNLQEAVIVYVAKVYESLPYRK